MISIANTIDCASSSKIFRVFFLKFKLGYALRWQCDCVPVG